LSSFGFVYISFVVFLMLVVDSSWACQNLSANNWFGDWNFCTGCSGQEH